MDAPDLMTEWQSVSTPPKKSGDKNAALLMESFSFYSYTFKVSEIDCGRNDHRNLEPVDDGYTGRF